MEQTQPEGIPRPRISMDQGRQDFSHCNTTPISTTPHPTREGRHQQMFPCDGRPTHSAMYATSSDTCQDTDPRGRQWPTWIRCATILSPCQKPSTAQADRKYRAGLRTLLHNYQERVRTPLHLYGRLCSHDRLQR